MDANKVEMTSSTSVGNINKGVTGDGELQPLIPSPSYICTICRKSEQVEDFEQINVGDHIQTPMFCMKCCFRSWRMYHHAIVEEVRINTDGKHADIRVIDIPHKMCCSTLMRPLSPFCFCWFPFKMERHSLQDNKKIPKEDIEIVRYKCCPNYQTSTLPIAIEAFTKNESKMKENGGRCFCSFKESYCLCIRNCEHFAVGTVLEGMREDRKGSNGLVPEVVKEVTCLQSASCFWFLFHFFMSIFQFGGYVFSFYTYAVFAEKNESYNHYFGNSTTSAVKWCFKGYKTRGFSTVCDWMIFGGITGLYGIIFIILCLLQKCEKLCGKECRKQCNQCIVSARILYLTKFVCFCIIEIINIFLEKPFYCMFEAINGDVCVTWFIIFLFSSSELIFLFFVVPRCIVKSCLIKYTWACFNNRCCSKICIKADFDKHSFKYVHHA